MSNPLNSPDQRVGEPDTTATVAKPPRAADRLRGRSAVIALGLGLFALYALTATYGRSQSVDTISALLPAWQLAQHGTLDLSAYLHFTPWINEYGDRVLSDRQPGVILFGVPFYRLLGIGSGPTYYPAAIAAATSAAAAMAALFALLRRIVAPLTALVATLIAAFGTATWTVSADALWPHGPDQLWLVVVMIGLASKRWWLAGLASALSILTRPHLAVAAAVNGIWLTVTTRSWRPVVIIGAFSAAAVLGLRWWAAALFGSNGVLVGAYATRTGTAASTGPLGYAENLAGTFVSPVRGILVMSPFLLALLPGLIRAWRVAPDWVRSSAVGGLAYLLVQLLGNYFAGGSGFFSYRLTIETLTLCAPLLALCWTEWTSRTQLRRVSFAVLAVFAVAQHAVGAFAFVDSFDPRTRAWSRYLPAEGLAHASPWQWLGVLAAILAAGWLASRLIKSRNGPPRSH